jgi:hypothetical protein
MRINEVQLKKVFPAIVAMFLLLAGCNTTAVSINPAWVDKLIQQFENMPVGNPPQSVWRYDYNGQTVYFVSAQCCDMYSVLYDANGVVLCAPDGGFTGKGDGKCPDFIDKRTNEQLIWQDVRTP